MSDQFHSLMGILSFGSCSRQTGYSPAFTKQDLQTAADITRRKNPKGYLPALDSDPSLTSWRLQVLFHSLSKVLFIFRSRYLCAIGLSVIFSLGSGIPAIRTAFPSSTTLRLVRFISLVARKRGYHPLRQSFPGTLFRAIEIQTNPYTTIPPGGGFGLDSSRFARRY